MELRHLRYFIKAAELLHFTKAAEALYVSQPTLSVHIHQLESELGTELFVRTGRNVRLTAAGELFLARARDAVRQLELASEEIEAITGLLRGTLTIAALPLFSAQYMPQWITQFNSLYPNVHVKARSGSSEDVEAAVMDGTVDLGFTVAPITESDLITQDLFTGEVFLVVSRNHPLAKKKSLEVQDFNMLEIAFASTRISTAVLARQWFDSHQVQPLAQVEFDDGNALAAIAAMGRLAAIVPDIFVKTADVVPFSFPDNGLRFTATAAWQRMTPAAHAFLEVAAIASTQKQEAPTIT